MTHEQARALLVRRFEEGGLTALEEQALRSHLRSCEQCRAAYDRYAIAEEGLEGAPGVQSEAQLARMRDRVPVPEPSRRGWVVGVVVAVAAALVLGFLLLRPEAPEYAMRGGEEGSGVGLRAFTKRAGKTAPIEAGVKVGDGLLFAYSMESGAPHRFLAIAGRDARAAVHWFHPAYEAASDTPRSVPVRAGVADEPLSEVVYVDLAPGPLEICGLFTGEALDVRSVDEWLTANPGAWPNHARACLTVEVQP